MTGMTMLTSLTIMMLFDYVDGTDGSIRASDKAWSMSHIYAAYDAFDVDNGNRRSMMTPPMTKWWHIRTTRRKTLSLLFNEVNVAYDGISRRSMILMTPPMTKMTTHNMWWQHLPQGQWQSMRRKSSAGSSGIFEMKPQRQVGEYKGINKGNKGHKGKWGKA